MKKFCVALLVRLWPLALPCTHKTLSPARRTSVRTSIRAPEDRPRYQEGVDKTKDGTVTPPKQPLTAPRWLPIRLLTQPWMPPRPLHGAKSTAAGVSDASKATYDGAKEGTAVTVKYTEKAAREDRCRREAPRRAQEGDRATDATKKAADKTADAVK